MESTRARRSKIGRLPDKLRNELCERIHDGAQGAAILQWLNATPEWKKAKPDFGGRDINSQNLSEWRRQGYGDWLRGRPDPKPCPNCTRLIAIIENLSKPKEGK